MTVLKSLFPFSLNKHSMIIQYQRLVRIDKILNLKSPDMKWKLRLFGSVPIKNIRVE